MCKLVKKCDCCNAMFSNIDLYVINAQHTKTLSIILRRLFNKLNLEGEPSLIVRDGQILAVRYEYANQLEIDSAKFIVKAIDDTCVKFVDELMNECHAEFISLAA